VREPNRSRSERELVRRPLVRAACDALTCAEFALTVCDSDEVRGARASLANTALKSSVGMQSRSKLSLVGLVVVAVLALFFPELRETLGLGETSVPEAPGTLATPTRPDGASVDTSIGFRSRGALDEHFEKHGAEFGVSDRERYLRLACELRDAPLGSNVLEGTRSDGVITRFDARTGAFVAFNRDRTLRTFFKPNDGRAYFERQLERDTR
jgi:hypothetical protein